MAQAIGCCGSLLWDELQHGEQEVSETLSLLLGPLVFVHQHLHQAPGLQLGDVLQVTWGREHKIIHTASMGRHDSDMTITQVVTIGGIKKVSLGTRHLESATHTTRLMAADKT